MRVRTNPRAEHHQPGAQRRPDFLDSGPLTGPQQLISGALSPERKIP